MPDADRGAHGRLIDQSVHDFVAAVASAETPVPAGGSVVALSGSCAAALLALVCEVAQRHQSDVLGEERQVAQRLQRLLLKLVDEDAAAYQAFLATRRGTEDRQAAINRVAATPLAIGRACVEVIGLTRTVEDHTRGALLGDVHAARHLAQAAVRTAVDLAEQNLGLQPDASARRALEAEITRLRGALAG
ncbi:MAG: cyclodeaminase/cyclohydrolase family protein [Chloroflexi bacterium]|nr:cyclodeaminase/cyclohydrolase family protein [Chloroflexota bacterium]MBV9597724.1 cyclodeaminase/cyclohydrolase family protein [Chloroflexota bacterium]